MPTINQPCSLYGVHMMSPVVRAVLVSLMSSNCPLVKTFSDATHKYRLSYVPSHSIVHTLLGKRIAWQPFICQRSWGVGRWSLKICHWSVFVDSVVWLGSKLQWSDFCFGSSFDWQSQDKSRFHQCSQNKTSPPNYIFKYSDWQTFSNWTKNTAGIELNMQWSCHTCTPWWNG